MQQTADEPRRSDWSSEVCSSDLLCTCLVVNWPGIRAGYAVRDFTLQQRLLTEPRILFDYPRQILAPNYIARGLLFDGYPASTGWLFPPNTLLSVILLALAVKIGRASCRERVCQYV